MDANRKLWNQQQKKLRQALDGSTNRQNAIELFLNQHAMVHSAKMSKSGLWSFEDEIWQDLAEATIRSIPQKFNHSIAWVIWYLARIEDITMNLLVAGSQQIMIRDNWLKRLNITFQHTGNGMDDEGIAQLSAKINVKSLKSYRLSVGRRTREIVGRLQLGEMKQKVKSARLQKVWDEGAMLENARWIVNYWSKRSIAGLLLMPPTRHCFLHLNEARRIRQKLI